MPLEPENHFDAISGLKVIIYELSAILFFLLLKLDKCNLNKKNSISGMKPFLRYLIFYISIALFSLGKRSNLSAVEGGEAAILGALNRMPYLSQIQSTYQYVFGGWEVGGEPKGNPCSLRKNIGFESETLVLQS